MATTKVTTPDGKSFKITHKEGASRESIADYVNKVAYPTAAAKEKGAFDFLFDAEAKFRSDAVEGTEASVGGVQQLFANTWRKTKDLYYDNVEAGLNLVGKLDAKTREELKVARQRATRSIDLYEEIADLQREPMRKLGKAIEDSRYMQQDNIIAQGALEVIGTIGYMTPMLAAGIATRGGSFPTLVAAAQATEEAVSDMENTLNKDQSEFTNEEKNQLADVSTIYGVGSALLAQMPIKALGLDRLGPGTFSKFLRGEIKLPAGGLVRTLKAGAAEAVEESAQGQFLDTLARFSYDDDRQLVGKEVLKDRLHEATIAFFAGGAIRGGGEVVSSIGNIKMPTPKREALSEEEVGNKKKFNVKYKRTQKAVGKADEVFDEESPFYAETLEEAKEIAGKTLGEQDGIDVDSITVEEFVEPTAEPTVEPTVEPVVDEEPITEVTKIQQELAELADVFAAEMETKGSAPEIRKQIQAKEAELKVAEEAQSKARQEARDAEVKAETDRILKEQKERIAQGKALFDDFGVFSDVDLETTDLTPEQKAEIIELRKEAQAEAKKILQSLEDPTGQIDTEVIKKGLDALEDPTGAVDTKAVAEGLEALRQISEEGTVGATTEQKQLFNKIREIERRQAEVLGREYIPRTDSSIVREIERTIVRSPMQRGASGALFVGATTADATTNRTDGRVVEPTGKVTKLVPDGEKLYEIKTTVKTSVRGSVAPEGRPSAEFQPVIRYVTAKSAQEAKQKYKDSNDRAIQEQKRDSRANYPSTVQDEISQRASYKVREIKDYDNDDKTIIRNLFDASGFVFLKDTPFGIDPLIRGEAVGATDIVEQIDDDVDLEHGEVAGETVDGESLGDAPVVGASVNLPNAPQISRKDFKGKKGFFFFSDRTRVGDYTGLFPEDGIKIKLQGGPAYAFIQKNLDKLAGWAFTSENIFSKFLDKVKATDGIGFITLYKKENLRANGTFLKAYVAEVKAAIKAKRLTTKQFLESANIAREQVVNLKSKNAKTGKITFTVARDGRGYKLFSKPFKSIDTFEKAMELVGFEPRGKMFDVRDKVITRAGRRIKVPGELSGGRLASISNTSKGLPDVIKMIDLFSDPALEGRDRGDVIGAVQFDQEQTSSTTAQKLGTEEHLSYPLVIKGKGIGAFSDPTNILDVVQINKRRNQALRSAETSMPTGTVGATDQQGKTDAQRSVIDTAVSDAQKLAQKLDVKIVADNTINRPAQYNYETQTIQYNPQLLASGGKAFSKAAMREEVIHAAMHKVIMKRNPKLSAKAAFEKAMSSIGSSLTQEQKSLMEDAYGELGTDLNYGAEYTRFAVQHILDGKTTEGTLFRGKAYEKLESLIKSVQAYVARILGPELKTNEEAAYIIADTINLLTAVDPNAKPAQQKIVDQAAAVVAGTNQIDSELMNDPFMSEEQREKQRSKHSRNRSLRRVFQTASLYFQDIHTEIARVLRNYYNNIDRRQLEATRMIISFQRGIAGIKNKADKSRIKQLLAFNPRKKDLNDERTKKLLSERDNLLLKYNLYNDFHMQVRPLLERLRNDAISKNMEIGYVFEYFPRRVRDLAGLMNHYGKGLQEDFTDYLNELNIEREAKGELKLTDAEVAAEFDKYLREKRFINPSRIPGYVKQRVAGELSAEELKFYYEPEETIGMYANSIIVASETADLLGQGAVRPTKVKDIDGARIETLDLQDPTGTLNAKVGELINRGELDKKKIQDLEYGLSQLFGPMRKSENALAEFGRAFSYGSLLIDPTTTLSQLYDLAFIALDNNLIGTAKALLGKKEFNLRMAGIDPTTISAEFAPNNKGKKKFLSTAVRKGLLLSGFTRMDALLKETNLTANYRRYRRLAKLSPNSAKFKKFRAEMEFAVGQDADRVIADLKNNVHDSPYVREVVVRKLLETQPINRFEMPLIVSNNPNSRMWYTMKSFVVKQTNLVGNRMIAKIIAYMRGQGSRDEALKALIELIYLMTLFQIVGIPVDFIKDMIAGRDVYPDDYVGNAFLRMFGLSKYNLYQAAEGDLFQSTVNYLAPVPIAQVFAMGQSVRDVASGKDTLGEFELIKYLPMNDVWYNRFGPGAITQEKKAAKKEEKGILPLLEL